MTLIQIQTANKNRAKPSRFEPCETWSARRYPGPIRRISDRPSAGQSDRWQIEILIAVRMWGNVAVTQLVDRPVYGVHVKMAKSIFK